MFLKEGSRFRGVVLTFFPLAEKPLKEAIQHFNNYTRSCEKEYVTFALISISFLAPWWFFLCWQKQISGPPRNLMHTRLASCSLFLGVTSNFKSSFSLSEVPLCLGEDYRLNSTESNWISLPLHFWSIPLCVDSGFLLKILLSQCYFQTQLCTQMYNCWFGGKQEQRNF